MIPLSQAGRSNYPWMHCGEMNQFVKITIWIILGLQFRAIACNAGDVFDWNPFQVKAYLKPGYPLSMQLDNLMEGNDIPYIYSRDIYEQKTNAPIRGDASPRGSLKLNVSWLGMNLMWRDAKEEERRERLTGELLKTTVPSLAMDWKGRESLENMGKFFEPKVNLELRF